MRRQPSGMRARDTPLAPAAHPFASADRVFGPLDSKRTGLNRHGPTLDIPFRIEPTSILKVSDGDHSSN